MTDRRVVAVLQTATDSGWRPDEETCNTYAMVWSALPYFSVCADGSSQVCKGLTPCDHTAV